jgi:alkylation response protein AidB-like acyl-CoA dehydrogenase
MRETSGTTSARRAIDGNDLLERVNALQSLITADAEAAESQGRLTDEVVDALHTSGAFGMWAPRSHGGLELDPSRSLDVIAALSYADGSTGWVFMAASLAIATDAGYMGDAAVDDVWGGGERFPVLAGQGTRPGKAVRDGDGYRLTGQWTFASGIKHADYVHTMAMIEGTRELRFFIFPVEHATLIETWDVMGLRATGSIDYTVDDLFVPEAYTHFKPNGDPTRGDLYRLGNFNFACVCHAGWAIGMGRRALDELAALAQTKTGRAGQLVDSDSFHGGFAEAEAKLRAATALVHQTWAEIEESIYAGQPISVRQSTMARLALNHVTWSAQEVVAFAYRNAGTSALYNGSLQRVFRDMHAGTQHVSSGQAILQACGRELAGLAPGQVWQSMLLTDAQ